MLFVEVVEVSRRPSTTTPATDVAAVIESRIVSAGFRYPRWGERAFPAHVMYGSTLYDRGGATVATWSVEGAASFREIPEVRQWLAARIVR